MSVLFAGLNERRREMAILRASGASPRHVFFMLSGESVLLTVMGVLLGVGLHYMVIAVGSVWAQAEFGIGLNVSLPGEGEWLILAAIFVAGLCAGLLPAWRAYSQSLSDGMMQRL